MMTAFLFIVSGCRTDVAYRGISADLPTGSAAIAGEGLVAAFDMGTVTEDGSLRDFSGAQNHGEIMGTSLVTGRSGEARRFLRPADRIHLRENATLAIDGPLTLALWLRVDQLGLHQHILACDDKFALWVTPQNRIRFSDTLGHGVDTAEPIEGMRWYSLVAVWDGTYGDEVTQETVRLYLDGLRVAGELVNRTNDAPLRWLPGELYPRDACYIGFESHQGNETHQQLPFVGVIDEVTIFTRPLRDDEIQAHADLRS